MMCKKPSSFGCPWPLSFVPSELLRIRMDGRHGGRQCRAPEEIPFLNMGVGRIVPQGAA